MPKVMFVCTAEHQGETAPNRDGPTITLHEGKWAFCIRGGCERHAWWRFHRRTSTRLSSEPESRSTAKDTQRRTSDRMAGSSARDRGGRAQRQSLGMDVTSQPALVRFVLWTGICRFTFSSSMTMQRFARYCATLSAARDTVW